MRVRANWLVVREIALLLLGERFTQVQVVPDRILDPEAVEERFKRGSADIHFFQRFLLLLLTLEGLCVLGGFREIVKAGMSRQHAVFALARQVEIPQ